MPDGKKQPLIHIPRWDFRWQEVYVYAEPVRLPKGTRIDAVVSYDNSAANPANPVTPPQRVRSGWGSTDEMCLVFMAVLLDDESNRRDLYRAMRESFRSPSSDGKPPEGSSGPRSRIR